MGKPPRPYRALKIYELNGEVCSQRVIPFATAESMATAIEKWDGALMEQWRISLKPLPPERMIFSEWIHDKI